MLFRAEAEAEAEASMRMIDLGSQRGPLHMHVHMNMKVMDTPITSVECGREIRFRRSFRSLMECVVPCCGFQPSSTATDSLAGDVDADAAAAATAAAESTTTHHHGSSSSSSSTVTGTFFGYRKGRVSFCIQDDRRRSSRSSPLLLLEFTVPTAFLAREMQYGLLRIALVECGEYSRSHITSASKQGYYYQYNSSSKINTVSSSSSSCSSSSLFNVPVWAMYCNGRKVGFAMRRQMTIGDVAVLKLMQSVSVGAGVLPPITTTATATTKSPSEEEEECGSGGGGELMYLRASFERVIGSADSESFHMINPVGSSSQELSIFLLRS